MEIPQQRYHENEDDPNFKYVRHLYVSMGKIASSATGQEKSDTQLVDEFLYNREIRMTQLHEWIDQQRLFVERRNKDIQRANSPNGTATVSENQILAEAWQLLLNVVSRRLYRLLRRMWLLLATIGVKDDEHTAYSWHLAAILYYWIQEGIDTGTIPIIQQAQTPYRIVLIEEEEEKEDTDATQEDDEEKMIMIGICQHLASLRCYLNLTASSGEAILRRRATELNMPVYLCRLSATKPGVFVLQFAVPGERQSRNVRLGTGTHGNDYNFYWSPRDLRMACESLIVTLTRKKWPKMMPLYPSVREMMGLTDDYLDYYGGSVSRGGGIAVKTLYLDYQ